jgi:flagellar export protein FliJ
MKSFQFPLQKALDWRRTQLELAEVRLQRQLAALAELDRARAELEATGIRTEVEVRGFHPLAGRDLNALGSFHLLIKVRAKQIAHRRVENQKELAARQADLLEARRRYRLLERLKERRWAEWLSARDRDLEELAADSYLSQWNRRQA